MGTDYSASTSMHWPRAAFDQPDLWEMLSRQVQAGKIRLWDAPSAPTTTSIRLHGAIAAGAGTIRVVFNRLDRPPEAAVSP